MNYEYRKFKELYIFFKYDDKLVMTYCDLRQQINSKEDQQGLR